MNPGVFFSLCGWWVGWFYLLRRLENFYERIRVSSSEMCLMPSQGLHFPGIQKSNWTVIAPATFVLSGQRDSLVPTDTAGVVTRLTQYVCVCHRDSNRRNIRRTGLPVTVSSHCLSVGRHRNWTHSIKTANTASSIPLCTMWDEQGVFWSLHNSCSIIPVYVSWHKKWREFKVIQFNIYIYDIDDNRILYSPFFRYRHSAFLFFFVRLQIKWINLEMIFHNIIFMSCLNDQNLQSNS